MNEELKYLTIKKLVETDGNKKKTTIKLQTELEKFPKI